MFQSALKLGPRADRRRIVLIGGRGEQAALNGGLGGFQGAGLNPLKNHLGALGAKAFHWADSFRIVREANRARTFRMRRAGGDRKRRVPEDTDPTSPEAPHAHL